MLKKPGLFKAISFCAFDKIDLFSMFIDTQLFFLLSLFLLGYFLTP